MVNCHCLAFSGFGPTATRLRFCFLLLVAEGIDVFAKGSVNFTIGKLIDELEAFERFKARGRTAEYLRLDSRARAYPWHCGRSLQTHRLVGSRDGCRSAGTRGLGTVGSPESECPRLDSTRRLLLRVDRFQEG